MAPLIEMRKVTKEYRGVPAIKDVDFTLEAGEIHALVGENGAGKSTLTKIMAGVTGPTSGTMLFDGKPTAFQSPAEALQARHQHGLPGKQPGALDVGGPERFPRRREILQPHPRHLHRRAAADGLAQFPGRSDGDGVGTLGAAKKQMVEIARAVRQNARVIIFDEPTAIADARGEAAFLLARWSG